MGAFVLRRHILAWGYFWAHTVKGLLNRIWKYLAVSVAVLAGAALAYFVGGSQKRGTVAAAVDATKSADALTAAVEQQAVARQKMQALAEAEIEQTHLIQGQRQDLAAGKVDTTEIDTA